MNTLKRGFTVIELFFVIVILAGAGVLFFVQKNNLEVAARDETRKTAINAMYYSLEEVFYKTNNYYPRTIDEKVLTSIDPALFTDPENVKLGNADSDYRYEPLNCTDNACKGYSLRTILENEDDYVKTNKNKSS